jgi:hypothetical protein
MIIPIITDEFNESPPQLCWSMVYAGKTIIALSEGAGVLQTKNDLICATSKEDCLAEAARLGLTITDEVANAVGAVAATDPVTQPAVEPVAVPEVIVPATNQIYFIIPATQTDAANQWIRENVDRNAGESFVQNYDGYCVISLPPKETGYLAGMKAHFTDFEEGTTLDELITSRGLAPKTL